MTEGFRSVSISEEIYQLLVKQADSNCRTIAGQLKFLIQQEENVNKTSTVNEGENC